MIGRMMVVVVAVVLIAGAADGVTGRIGQETTLYGETFPVLGTIRTGTVVELIEQTGKWYKVRVQTDGDEDVDGVVAVGAFVKKGGTVEALRDATVYATSRAVLMRMPAGATVELARMVKGGYVVRWSAADADVVQGLVAAAAIQETDEVKAWRDELVAAEAEAREFEARYQAWRYKYALVEGEYVRLPDFDLSKASSDPDGGSELPAWKVGEFGHVAEAVIDEVFGDERALVVGRIYQERTITIGASGRVVSNPRALRSLEAGKSVIQQEVDERLLFVGWSMADMADGHLLWFEHDKVSVGACVAIIGNYTYTTPIGAKVVVLRAIPLAQVRQGLTREQFRELLKELADRKE